MKRTLMITLSAVAVIHAVQSHAETGIATHDVFVRSAPYTGSRIIGILPKRTIIEYSVPPENRHWIKISFNKRPAFVARKLIDQAMPLKLAAKVPPSQVDAAKTVAVTPVLEIVTNSSTEELRLRAENERKETRIKELEAEIRPLKEEVARLRDDLQTQKDQIQKYHAMFPYLKAIENVETNGKNVMLTGIGKAKVVENDRKVIIRIEGDAIAAGDKVMKGVALERYQTGNAHQCRVYFVLSSKSVKSVR